MPGPLPDHEMGNAGCSPYPHPRRPARPVSLLVPIPHHVGTVALLKDHGTIMTFTDPPPNRPPRMACESRSSIDIRGPKS